MNGIYLTAILFAVCVPQSVFSQFVPYERLKCKNGAGLPFKPHSVFRHRVNKLRLEMKRRPETDLELHAYILTTYDEHQNERVAARDKRIEFLTGFTGTSADVVITHAALAIWTEQRYLVQADYELNCDWIIFKADQIPNIPAWISAQLPDDSIVGADPHTVPHVLWDDWQAQLSSNFIRLVKVNRNLVDHIWESRPRPSDEPITVQPILYAGNDWKEKISEIRSGLLANRINAMVVTSLTEIAYILNLRGQDLPYTPVFKAYLIISHEDIILYVNQTKIDSGIKYHLRASPCTEKPCVIIKDYDAIWMDLPTKSHHWNRILIPRYCVFDMGASEAIYSRVPEHKVAYAISPIIMMRAKKNAAERAGMRKAHIIDGAAMCETLSYIEQRFDAGTRLTEMWVANETDRSRRAQLKNKGLSARTRVAFGSHGSYPHYESFNITDIEVNDRSTLIIESGGQYLDGTTTVTRTIHLGMPSQKERTAYTNVLRGIIRLSTLVFPENLRPSELDALIRGLLWGSHTDYPQSTGHGIGSFLSVNESPINIAYSTQQNYTFKDGYFFSSEPGFYQAGDFGVRIANVLEVVDTDKRHPSGSKFLAFSDVTLVPYEDKLIDVSLLSTQEKKWLNNYNAQIRQYVGEELKQQVSMQAFYWMMNKTRHVIEYYPESEYRKHHSNNGAQSFRDGIFSSISIVATIIMMAWW